jgi:hypothetical protein
MSQSKWTPGPWRVDFDCLEEIVAGRSAVLIAFAHHSRPQVEANARLIAAAPEMAEALRVVLDSQMSKGGLGGGYFTLSGDTIRLIETALAKAEGRDID